MLIVKRDVRLREFMYICSYDTAVSDTAVSKLIKLSVNLNKSVI